MQYYVLTPPVYGQLAKGTVFKKGSREVLKPVLMIEQVPREDLMSAGGANIFISTRLANELRKSNLDGFRIDEVEMYKSSQFEITNPQYKKALPEFKWLQIVGLPMEADFYRHENYLAISETALAFLSTYAIQKCEVIKVEEFPSTWEERKKQLFQKARQHLEKLGSDSEYS